MERKALRNLRKYGVTDEARAAAKAAGLLWCSAHKDWVEAAEMGGRTAGYCRSCFNEYLKTRGSLSRWHSHLRKKFNIEPEWYVTRERQQQGLCAICNKPNGKRRLAVDHDHQTGKLRGLLCTNCNVALERLDSIPGWADRAKTYIEKFL